MPTSRDEDLPPSMHEIVPAKLRELVRQEPIVEAAFATAVYGRLTRESALVQCVTELCRERRRQHIIERHVALRSDTLALLERFALEWTTQEGCNAGLLDRLAQAAQRDIGPPRYIEALRRFVRAWDESAKNAGLALRQPSPAHIDWEALMALADAFEEAERRG